MIKEFYLAYYIGLVNYFKWIKDKDAEFSALIAITTMVTVNIVSIVLFFSTRNFLEEAVYYFITLVIFLLFTLNYFFIYRRRSFVLESPNRYFKVKKMNFYFIVLTVVSLIILAFSAMDARHRIVGPELF